MTATTAPRTTASTIITLRRPKRSSSQPATRPPTTIGAMYKKLSRPRAWGECVVSHTYQVNATRVIESPTCERAKPVQK